MYTFHGRPALDRPLFDLDAERFGRTTLAIDTNNTRPTEQREHRPSTRISAVSYRNLHIVSVECWPRASRIFTFIFGCQLYDYYIEHRTHISQAPRIFNNKYKSSVPARWLTRKGSTTESEIIWTWCSIVSSMRLSAGSSAVA